jgi:hypothetical protein
MSDWASIRGDAAKLHTDPRNVIFRPMSVGAAVLLLKVGAVVNLVWGAVIVYLSIAEDAPFVGNVGGPLGVGSDKFWFWTGLFIIFLGYYGWKRAPGVSTGERAAQIPSISVSILNVLLGLLAFPWGLFQGVIGLLQFLALNSEGNEQWITKDVTQHG